MSENQHPNVEPWQLGFQEPVTPVMEQLDVLHDGLTITITIITLFVMALLFIIIWKFRESKNPTPSKVTHNTPLEIAWTVIPILILVAISIPSLRTHYYMDKAPNPDMVLKIVGYQWYWNYEYPDSEGISFDSYMIKDEDLKEGDVRLLSVDNPIVVPVDTTVAVHMTGGDVIHAWAVPAFGVKQDALPGRLNETWFKATKQGVYFGQCSELCGVGHGFMPIEVHVVSKVAYAAWVEGSKAALDGGGEYNSRTILQQVQQDPAVIAAEAEAAAALIDVAADGGEVAAELEAVATEAEAAIDAKLEASTDEVKAATDEAKEVVKEKISKTKAKATKAVTKAKQQVEQVVETVAPVEEAVEEVKAKVSSFNSKANAKIDAKEIINQKAGE